MSSGFILDQLCDLCNSIFSDTQSDFDDQGALKLQFHDSYGLENSAAQGCHFCSLVLDCVDDEKFTELQGRDRQSRSKNVKGNPLLLEMRKRKYEYQPVSISINLLERAPSGPGDNGAISQPLLSGLLRRNADLGLEPASSFHWCSAHPDGVDEVLHAIPLLETGSIVSRVPSASVINEHSRELMRQWIQICDESHTECSQRRNPPDRRIPKRLLEVTADASGRIRLHLVDTIKLPSSTQYMTVSHRWDRAKTPRLLKSNEESFRKNIEITTLPQTFIDAIELTRSLDINHLWIDSLCIIQDCDEDMAEQINSMDDIYSYSHINVAAIAASEGIGGLDRERNPLANTPCRIRTKWKDATFHDLCCFDVSSWQDFVEVPVLNTRGWVVQERLLASRAINFASDQVYWECASLRASEYFPSGLPYEGADPVSKENMKALLNPRTGDTDENPFDFNAIWTNILRFYTRSDLTFESDRFNALSGVVGQLARIFEHDKDSDYVAGLWKPYLDAQLHWYAERLHPDRNANVSWSWVVDGTKKSVPAPSWSWASFGGSVEYDYFANDEQSLISIIQAGPVDDLSNEIPLKLQGYLCGLSSILPDGPDATPVSRVGDLSYEEQVKEVWDVSSWDDNRNIQPPVGSARDSVFILLIRQSRDLSSEEGMIWVLIVELTGKKRGQYRRIGSASFSESEDDTCFGFNDPDRGKKLIGGDDTTSYPYMTALSVLRCCKSMSLPEHCFETFEKGKGYLVELV